MRNDFCINYLAHSAKGKEWARHRYVAKVRLPSGKWFYFYDANRYQNYLKRKNGGNKTPPSMPQSKEIEEERKNLSTLKSYASKSTAEKKAVTKEYISKGKDEVPKLVSSVNKSSSDPKKKNELSEAGKKKTEEILNKTKDKNAKKSKGKTSSKKTSGSSGNSKSSSGKKSSGTKKGSGEATSKKKDKTLSEKNNKEKQKERQVEKQPKPDSVRPFTPDVLKKHFNIEDKDVNTHSSTEELIDKIKTYKDGTNGYVIVGDKIYKWSKNDGNITFMDYETDKEVTLSPELNNIQEFVINGKKKK